MRTAPEIISSFKDVIAKGDGLKRHLLDLNPSQVWINQKQSAVFEKELHRFISAMLDYYPLDYSTAKQTSAYQGALGGSIFTLELASELNDTKDEFRLICNEFLKEQNQKKTKMIHTILEKAGFASIKLKQVYRHIPLIDYHPRLISYCQLKHNSKIKISKNKAREKLLKVGKGDNIDIQLDWLAKTDSKLVIHRETSEIWAANISSFKNENNRVITKKITTSLPIIYLMNDKLPLPDVRFSEQRTRNSRIDKIIEENPFLKSIHAYKYK